MTVQWNPDLLNSYVANGIADFTSANMPDLSGAFPDIDNWTQEYALRTIFQAQYAGRARQYVFNLIMLARASLEEYTQARELTLEFLDKSPVQHAPNSGAYYRALRRWESLFLIVQREIGLVNRLLGTKKSDYGTVAERAWEMAGAIKHWADQLNGDAYKESDLLPMWLTTTGFQTKKHSLTFDELAELVLDLVKAAESLKDPSVHVYPPPA